MIRWRWMIYLLGLASILLVASAIQFGWEPRASFRSLREEWRQDSPYFSHLSPETPSNPVFSALGAYFSLSLSGILVLFAFPGQVKRMENTLRARPAGLARLALMGFLTALLVGAVTLSSTMSMGTFPLMIILGSLLFLSSFMGLMALAYALGRAFFRRAGWNERSPVYALLFGLLVIFALGQIPFVGMVITALFISLGLGTVLETRFGSGTTWNLALLMED